MIFSLDRPTSIGLNIHKHHVPQWKVLVCLTCLGSIIFLIFNPNPTQASLLIDADAQYTFALKLFNQTAYSGAISEFRRFTHFFPNDSRAPEAMTYIGKAFFISGRYDKAIETFQTLIDRYEGQKATYRAFFQISDCYIELEKPQQAIITLQNLIALTDDTELVDEAYYRMGWIAVQAGIWQEAKRVFMQTTPRFRKEKRIDELLSALEAEKDISLKNPKLAGILSILPGAGQLYCRRYKDALSAFIINTGLILAAVEAFENDLYALGATISFFEFGFYSGNIYGAAASAHKYNQRATRRFGQSLQEQYRIGLLSSPSNSGIMLSFQYVY